MSKPIRNKLRSKRTFLVLVAIYERDLDEAAINAFRVRARSQAAAEDMAARIVGSDSWWNMVHGDDVAAREETVYGAPCVVAIPATTFTFRPLLAPKAGEVGRPYGDDEKDERLRAQSMIMMGKLMGVAPQRASVSRSLKALDGGASQP